MYFSIQLLVALLTLDDPKTKKHHFTTSWGVISWNLYFYNVLIQPEQKYEMRWKPILQVMATLEKFAVWDTKIEIEIESYPAGNVY